MRKDEWRETCREFSLRVFLSYLNNNFQQFLTVFIYRWNHSGMSAESAQLTNWYIPILFSMFYPAFGILYKQIYIKGALWQMCISKFCLIISSINCAHFGSWHVINVQIFRLSWAINSKNCKRLDGFFYRVLLTAEMPHS